MAVPPFQVLKSKALESYLTPPLLSSCTQSEEILLALPSKCNPEYLSTSTATNLVQVTLVSHLDLCHDLLTL